jgi:hypothetical protein
MASLSTFSLLSKELLEHSRALQAIAWIALRFAPQSSARRRTATT